MMIVREKTLRKRMNYKITVSNVRSSRHGDVANEARWQTQPTKRKGFMSGMDEGLNLEEL